MRVIEAREHLDIINLHQVGFGLAGDAPAKSFVHDLRLKAQLRGTTSGQPMELDLQGSGLAHVGSTFSTDEAEIDEDDWYTPEDG